MSWNNTWKHIFWKDQLFLFFENTFKILLGRSQLRNRGEGGFIPFKPSHLEDLTQKYKR